MKLGQTETQAHGPKCQVWQDMGRLIDQTDLIQSRKQGNTGHKIKIRTTKEARVYGSPCTHAHQITRAYIKACKREISRFSNIFLSLRKIELRALFCLRFPSSSLVVNRMKIPASSQEPPYYPDTGAVADGHRRRRRLESPKFPF